MPVSTLYCETEDLRTAVHQDYDDVLVAMADAHTEEAFDLLHSVSEKLFKLLFADWDLLNYAEKVDRYQTIMQPLDPPFWVETIG